MKYIIIGLITLVTTLLISKLLIAVNLFDFDNTPIIHEDKISHYELEKTGRSIYLVYCSSCHGTDGKGNNNKAQDHTRRITKESVVDIINNGANNFTSIYPSGMPASLIHKKEAKEVATYVASGLKGNKPKAWGTCAGCHSDDGEGIAFIAPNIKSYSNELVDTVLKNGKQGVIGRMPSFKGRFSDYQIKAVATHIRALGQNN